MRCVYNTVCSAVAADVIIDGSVRENSGTALRVVGRWGGGGRGANVAARPTAAIYPRVRYQSKPSTIALAHVYIIIFNRLTALDDTPVGFRDGGHFKAHRVERVFRQHRDLE